MLLYETQTDTCFGDPPSRADVASGCLEPEWQWCKVCLDGPDHSKITAEASRYFAELGAEIERWSGGSENGVYSIRCLIRAEREVMDAIRRTYRRELRPLSPRLYMLHRASTWTLDILSPDGPGIVSETSARLSRHKINIEWDERFQHDGTFGSPPLFRQNMIVTGPEGLTTLDLDLIVDDIARELGGHAQVLQGARLPAAQAGGGS